MSELKPGAELDALVLKQVFGVDPVRSEFHKCLYFDSRTGAAVASFSSEITAAFEVVEKFSEGECLKITKAIGCIRGEGKWKWSVYLNVNGYPGAQADTLPHAICLAALKAVASEYQSEERSTTQ